MVESLPFGVALRILRRQRGLSLADLAKSVHYSKGYLSRIENGQRTADIGLARLCDEVLGACGWLVSLSLTKPGRKRNSFPRPAQLPADVAGFAGHADAITRLNELICPGRRSSGQIPVKAICGAAGVGKTALAVRWAHTSRHRFPDGQLFIDLRGSRTDQDPVAPRAALGRFLRALGIATIDVPDEVEECATLYRSVLDGQRMLIVLDNAATARQLYPLLPGTASCAVVITSRDELTGLSALGDADHIRLDAPSHPARTLPSRRPAMSSRTPAAFHVCQSDL
jgi:DNA-binding XRE family transcriptional regulator